MNKLIPTLLLIPVIAITVGCPSSATNQLPTYSVTGKLTQGGAPVAGATITFSPISEGVPAAFGRSDAAGVYSLSTYGTGDGAVAGDYKVMVSKSSGGTSTGPAAIGHDPTGQNTPAGPPAGHSSRGRGADSGSGSLLPAEYASATTTPLSTIVEKKENVYDIAL